ncbi:DUF2147 domain-containing protein [Sphingomonas mollis]|nr:DUF2147 domain-containing protein [Sphingomonas sp. BT553]
MRMLILPLATMVAALTMVSAADAATPIAGRWLTEEASAIVTIAPCGAATCGRITKLIKGPPSGPPLDRNNPDARLRDRPIEGLVILTEFKDGGDDWRGRIYDPKSGKTYKSILKREADGGLKVQGCIAFFCRTQRWTAAR